MTKNISIAIGVLVFSLFASACKPIYTCGEAKPTKKSSSFFWTKRVKKVISERDTLCEDLKNERIVTTQLEKDTFELNNTIRERNNTIVELTEKNNGLTSDLNQLQNKYDDLMNENVSQAEQYSRALKQKSTELKNREDLLEEQKGLLAEREKTLLELQNKLARQDSITKALNEVIRKALLGFKSDELSVEIKNGKVYVSMSNKLLFKSGSFDVEAKGKEALEVLADVLNKNPDIDILVEGHTDTDPISTATIKDNWDLSTARATSIVRILTNDYKVTPKRITAAGRGEFMPKASNETAEGKAKNRRTEIILSPKLEEIMKLLGN